MKLMLFPDPWEYPGSPLMMGDKGPLVKEIQIAVNVLADGVFGEHTFRAVRSHQRMLRIEDDGVVGPVTWDAFFD